MTALDTIVYCLGFIEETSVDGEFLSQVVYDKNGQPHWIAFSCSDGTPSFCSESYSVFVKTLEPYRTYK